MNRKRWKPKQAKTCYVLRKVQRRYELKQVVSGWKRVDTSKGMGYGRNSTLGILLLSIASSKKEWERGPTVNQRNTNLESNVIRSFVCWATSLSIASRREVMTMMSLDRRWWRCQNVWRPERVSRTYRHSFCLTLSPLHIQQYERVEGEPHNQFRSLILIYTKRKGRALEPGYNSVFIVLICDTTPRLFFFSLSLKAWAVIDACVCVKATNAPSHSFSHKFDLCECVYVPSFHTTFIPICAERVKWQSRSFCVVHSIQCWQVSFKGLAKQKAQNTHSHLVTNTSLGQLACPVVFHGFVSTPTYTLTNDPHSPLESRLSFSLAPAVERKPSHKLSSHT